MRVRLYDLESALDQSKSLGCSQCRSVEVRASEGMREYHPGIRIDVGRKCAAERQEP